MREIALFAFRVSICFVRRCEFVPVGIAETHACCLSKSAVSGLSSPFDPRVQVCADALPAGSTRNAPLRVVHPWRGQYQLIWIAHTPVCWQLLRYLRFCPPGERGLGGDGVVADHVQPEGFPATRRPVSSCLLPASGPRSWPSTGPCRATPAAAPSAGWPLACGCGSRDNTPHAPGARSLPRAAVPAGRAPSHGPGAHGWRDLTFHTVAEQLRL